MSAITTVVPNIDLSLEHKDIILKAPSVVTQRQWVSTSYSNNQASFSCPPPSTSVFIDRCVVLGVPVTINYTGSTTGSALLQEGYDALRAYPIANITNNIQLNINDQTYSFQTSELVNSLSHYWKQSHRSTFPDFLDKYQVYADGATAVNNPLGTYGNSVGKVMPRGSFPMVIVNGATTASITVTIYEPLIMPILHLNHDDGLGLTNVKTFNVTVNYASTLSRIVCHATSSATLNTPTVTLGQPILYMRYSSPPVGYVPRPVEYACDNIERFVTSSGSALTSNSTRTITSSNIQLNCIPDWVLIMCRESNANLTYTSSDTYTRINSISLNFDNTSGILASATEVDLYNISKANQLQDTWEEWHGVTTNPATGVVKGTVGSVLVLKFGKDISLNPNSYVGKVGAYNFQAQVSVTNVNQAASIVDPNLYIITCTPQKTRIDVGGQCQNILGIPPDVQSSEYVSYREAMKHYGGSFTDFVSKIQSAVRPISDFLKKTKLISSVAKVIPNPLASTIGQFAEKMGYGDGEGGRKPRKSRKGHGDGEGDGEGGAVCSRQDLLDRLGSL